MDSLLFSNYPFGFSLFSTYIAIILAGEGTVAIDLSD